MKNFDLILYNIRSAYNVGAIFRSADGAGVNKIYLCGYTPSPPNPKISKSALGSENNVPWEKCNQTTRLIKKLKNNGYKIIGLELTKKSIPYFKFKPKFPLAIILGNEINGISQTLLKKCDKIIYIPMLGKKESLNVASAASITVYDIILKKHARYNARLYGNLY